MSSSFNGRLWKSARVRDIENQAGEIPLEQTKSNDDARSVNSGRSQLSSVPEESIDIRVGTGNYAKVFHINKNLICNSSEYFADVCSSNSSDGIDLAEDDPVVFDLFSQWVRRLESPISYILDWYSEELWRSSAAAAWVLARKLQAADFQKYALSQFIQNCASAAFRPWEYIEGEAPLRSPIRRFSDHWVAWNFHPAGPGTNEFSGLQAARQARLVTEKTRDPRTYDIEHWYSSCGDDMEPSCSHDIIAQQANLQQTNHGEEPQLEWGHSLETQREEHSDRSRSRSSSGSSPPTPYVSPIREISRQRIFLPARTPPISQPAPPVPANPNAQPNITSTSDDESGLLKYYREAIVGLIFGAQVIIILALCIALLGDTGDGIRYTTTTYSLFVACVGVLAVFIPPAVPGYVFFGFADGIATAVDAGSCWSAANSLDGYDYDYGGPIQPCQEITALSVFIWTSLPTSVLYFLMLYSVWKSLDS